MRTRIITFLCLSSLFLTLHGANLWSLDSCINYAMEHNLTVRSAMLDNMTSSLAVTEAKDRFLPSLSASASQNWDFGRSLTSENTYANRNTAVTGLNLQLSLPLFQGLSAVRQLRQSRSALKASGLQAEATRDEVTLMVMSYYLQALYNRELLAVSREQLRLSETQLVRQAALFEAGKVPEVDVIQARSQVAAAEVDTVNASNTLTLSLLDLAQALELPDPDGFDVESLDDSETTAPLMPLKEVMTNALEGYSTIRAARAALETADDAISVAKSGYLPQIYFNAGLSDNYYRMSGVSNSPFSRQMRDNFSKNVGFSLRIPIFDAFSTRNSVRRARLNRLSASLEVERRESDLRKAIRQAWTQADGASRKLRASDIATKAALEALDAMTEKYTYGKANATEWEQARTNYITTLSQQVQAKYEAILRTRILNFYNRR
ncbi:MAG: TolC family protein [Muribaculaceae bacterium]|nr:TolC family protein [Muribaculaceae bacterium]